MSAPTTKTDAQIQADVIDELRWDPAVSEAEVGVHVHNGIVTLTGDVGAYLKKLAARNAAHRVWGVLDVVDAMRVRMPLSWERPDEDLARAVRHALTWDLLVPDERITSTVSNGVVTLEGSVDSWNDRFCAEKAVEQLTGAKGVINQITVTAASVNSGEIKQHIEQALERRAERGAKRINIRVHDGVVTMTGSVRSWADKNAVERAAFHTAGVRRVEDRTVVDPYQ